ncbi:hypothetical protein DSO57_1037598 [Entomophthora muscae]|uniref:Uncharacterized protein n=1 Tax=Entomophthora muscae TaxID=34485 RepID=A0ACC2SZ17_9FUNG|nr:hypothetical protein DSO57_1037598 [Entomophthora muscae]
MFEEPLPVSSALPSGNPSGAQHPFPQRLPSTGAPPLPHLPCSAPCNSNNVVVDYPNLLSKFGICHHEETMYSFVQALHSDEDTMTPIWAGELYHSQYNPSCLAAEVRLGLQSATLAPSEISAQHAHTIAIFNKYIDKVAHIWALMLVADPSFHQTLYLPVQANTNCCFFATFKVFLQAVTIGNASLYLPLAAATCHFMWYPPESCQPGQLSGTHSRAAGLSVLEVTWAGFFVGRATPQERC